eukprot:2205294-Pyramimonas_sp.AAC.1
MHAWENKARRKKVRLDALDGVTASVLYFRALSLVLLVVYCFSYIGIAGKKYFKMAQDWGAVISLAAAVHLLGILEHGA